MNNPLDELGKKVYEKRNEQGLTQKELAEKLGMSHRTIMQAETCQSNPKFETVALLAQYLNFSLDAVVFPESISPNELPKCVVDFFSAKTEAEAEKFIALCKKAEDLLKQG